MELGHIKIRPFKNEEWTLLKSLRLRALLENPKLFLATYEESLLETDKFWLDMIQAKNGQVFGLFDGSKLIGITGVFNSRYDETGQTAHFVMSYIDPLWRGRGLSRLFYETRLAWAKENGFKKVIVSHREGNDASHAANQAFGFKFTGKEETTFATGRAMDYRYELIL